MTAKQSIHRKKYAPQTGRTMNCNLRLHELSFRHELTLRVMNCPSGIHSSQFIVKIALFERTMNCNLRLHELTLRVIMPK